MDHTAIGKIVDLGRAAAEPKQIEGVNYVSVDMKPVVDTRAPEPVCTRTLEGLCTFINDYAKPGIVVVHEEDLVTYYGEENKDMIRHKYAACHITERDVRFRFDEFQDNESFIIRLRSMFVETEDREKLLRYTSKLTVDNRLESHDDGVSQSATVKRGVSGALRESEVAPVIVNLAPYRTFTEVDQPVSSFLFRMREAHGGAPSCGLFVADGGDWRRQAMKNIEGFLIKNISVKGVHIIV